MNPTEIVDEPLLLSQLELLPKELVFRIIDYAPEAILDLRSTSRMCRSHVDEFVQLQVTSPLISKLETFNNQSRARGAQSFWHELIDILVYVPKAKAKLFNLRASIRDTPSEWCEKFTNRGIWQKYIKVKEDTKKRFVVFHTRFRPFPDDDSVEAYLMGCFGRHVGTVVLKETTDSTVAPIYDLLKPFHFDNIDLETSTLSDSILNHLLKMIREHSIEQVALNVKDVAAVNPESVLLDLSAVLRSLYIWQPRIAGLDKRSKFFFGVYNGDWASTILQMFTNKLDKLFIDNPAYPGYLSNSGANALIEKLPLINKKIWFATTLWRHSSYADHQLNDTVVNITESNNRHLLSVKHSTRYFEPFRFTKSEDPLQSLFNRFHGVSLSQQ